MVTSCSSPDFSKTNNSLKFTRSNILLDSLTACNKVQSRGKNP